MKNSFVISPELTQKVLDYVDLHKDEIVNNLIDLMRIPSFRGEAEPGMPYGRASYEAVEFSAQLFEKHGFSLERRGERGYALARTGPEGKTLGVFCHCDVVFPDTGVWEEIDDPFDPQIKDGYLVGRGAHDDKGAVICSLHALNALKSAGIDLKHSVMVYLGGNEETGFGDILNYVEDQPLPDVSLVPDCAFPIYRGEKSFSRFMLLQDKTFERILDFSGGNPAGVCGDATVTLPNDPQLKAELLAALGERSNPTLSENEKGELILFAKGVSTHPSAPLKSVNAGCLVAEILRQCPSLGENDLYIVEEFYQMTANITGDYFNVSFRDDDFGDLYLVNCHILTIDGHLHLESVAFYSPAYSFAELKKNMRTKCEQAGWALTYTRGSDGVAYPKNHPVVQVALQAHRDLCTIRNYPEGTTITEVPPFFAPTYARHIKNAFTTGFDMPHTVVPSYFSPGHGHAHQPDECIHVQSFLEGVLFMAMLIASIDGDLDTLPSAND